ncbi:hypothetical protein XA68_12498 [Ophiocordyceps unilateralis]|uniref:Uncharacterized protein n=1 Tax=Ophiocordyceps unilateralis TaxID=268505 RepID=A0A2A9NXE1_OPHUN|nr:hypothetical protein XA68_12498 [Ophiocordyceps unilateralis]
MLVVSLLSLAAVAVALPGPAATTTTLTTMTSPTESASSTTAPPVISLPSACDYSYCDGSSSWCFYWAGITSYDISRGPVPGETRVPLGPCGVTTTASQPTTRT